MASFLGVGGLYILLEAGFLAAAQLLVYIGAISILIIFAIMMTRRLMQTTESPYNSQWRWGILAAVLLFLLLAVLIFQTWPADTFSAPPLVSPATLRGSVTDLGKALVDVDQFVLPFEVASVLLLAALVGSIVIAWPAENFPTDVVHQNELPENALPENALPENASPENTLPENNGPQNASPEEEQ